MDIGIDDLATQCVHEISKKIYNLKRLNIIVIGKSGVGKSTLINSVFRENLAETGIGRPVTQGIRQIKTQGYPLTIYDTPGFELRNEQQQQVKDRILELIYNGVRSKDINQAIHCIWYCINVGGNRTFDSSELAWLKGFTAENAVTQVPIIIVLTQAVPKGKAKDMAKEIEKENLDIVSIVPVLAQDMYFDENYTARAYGLDTLVSVMQAALPDELQTTLQNVQCVSLAVKQRAAQAVVASAVASAFGAGFVPIPFSDAALLLPTQVIMLAGITAIYGFDISKAFLTCFVSSTIGASGATVLGKELAANILKLIPGVGTAIGGVISSSAAGLLTTALGEAYIKIMDMMYKNELSENYFMEQNGKELMKTLFKDELKKKR